MIGPVLYQELLLGGRRRRLHLLRWICGGLLWLQFVYLYTGALVQHYGPRAIPPALHKGLSAGRTCSPGKTRRHGKPPARPLRQNYNASSA